MSFEDTDTRMDPYRTFKFKVEFDDEDRLEDDLIVLPDPEPPMRTEEVTLGYTYIDHNGVVHSHDEFDFIM